MVSKTISKLSLPVLIMSLIVGTFFINQYDNTLNYNNIFNLKSFDKTAIILNNGEKVNISAKYTNNNQAGSIVDMNNYGELNLFLLIPESLKDNQDFLSEYQNLMISLRNFIDSQGFTVENFFKEVPKFQLGLDMAMQRYGQFNIVTRDSTPKFSLNHPIQVVFDANKNPKNHNFSSIEKFLDVDSDLSAQFKTSQIKIEETKDVATAK